jgi:hypothetical protein
MRRKFQCDEVLVDGVVHCYAQAFNLILDLQLPAFDFEDRDVIRRWMIHRIMKLIFENFVLSFQFCKMSLDRHWHLPDFALDG